MLFGFTYTYALKTSTRILETGTVAALEYAVRHGDAVYLFWPAFVVLVALAGAAAVWHGKTAWVLAAGIMLAGVSFLGVWSIGGAVAPVAAALLAAAAASTWCRKFTYNISLGHKAPATACALRYAVLDSEAAGSGAGHGCGKGGSRAGLSAGLFDLPHCEMRPNCCAEVVPDAPS